MIMPRKCKGSHGRACNCFLPAIGKDSHDICTLCRDQQCNLNLKYAHFQDGFNEELTRCCPILIS